MFKQNWWGLLAVAAVAPVTIGVVDPVGGRVLGWPNILFMTCSPFVVLAVVGLWGWVDSRVSNVVRCHRCDNPCRFSRYHSECGRKRWLCTTCNALRTHTGGPA